MPARPRLAAPSIDRLRELFDVDLSLGILRWRKRASSWTNAGDIAGHVSKDGYIVVGIDGVRYLAHHLIWFLAFGEWVVQIDHRDLNRSRNAIDNLRVSTQSQNLHNIGKPKHNTSGLKGASIDRRSGSWRAQICIEGKRTHLGQYATKELAHAAYVAAAKQHFGEFARAA